VKVPSKWKPWYEDVLELFCRGYKADQIATILKKHPNTIEFIFKMPEFQERAKIVTTQLAERHQTIDGTEILNSRKGALIAETMRIALSGEQERTRLMACTWLLERFPEFSQKASLSQQTNVYNLSREESDRLDSSADKMRELFAIMKDGNNPFVIDKSTAGDQMDSSPIPQESNGNDNTGHDAGDPGTDS